MLGLFTMYGTKGKIRLGILLVLFLAGMTVLFVNVIKPHLDNEKKRLRRKASITPIP